MLCMYKSLLPPHNYVHMSTLSMLVTYFVLDNLSKESEPRSGPTKCLPDLDSNCLTL